MKPSIEETPIPMGKLIAVGFGAASVTKDGTVPDGTPTHASASCEHHGGCPYCERNRMHSNERRIMEVVE